MTRLRRWLTRLKVRLYYGRGTLHTLRTIHRLPERKRDAESASKRS